MYELISFGGDSFFNYFDNLEKRLWGNSSKAVGTFKTDILDKGDKYLLQAELPGFKKEDIYIDLDGNNLTIQASHTNETENNSDKVVRKERQYSSFSRSFNVSGIKTDEITANYNNGILELQLPKVEEEKPKTILGLQKCGCL